MDMYDQASNNSERVEASPTFASPWFALYLAFRNGMRRLDDDCIEDQSSDNSGPTSEH